MSSLSERLLRLVSGYRAFAVFLLNTVLVFALANACAVGVLALQSSAGNPGSLMYGVERLSVVYPDRSGEEIRELLTETWRRRYAYEPFTQFKEGELSGTFVNVGPDGFRKTGHDLPWPPTADLVAVFVFGGSTSFGYGLSDEEAIPAQLQYVLAQHCGDSVAVYNLARSNYYSSQERVLFQRLLTDNLRPALAVFIDGLNEFGRIEDAPEFTRRLTYLMQETPLQGVRRLLVGLPLARLVKHLLRQPDLQQEAPVEPRHVDELVSRWLANRAQIRAVASANKIETLFVWQPIPTYGYDLAHHLFAHEIERDEDPAALGYSLVERLHRDATNPLGDDFLWLGDLQRDRGEALYVDRVHYTAAFSREIAEVIGARIAEDLCKVEG